MAMPASSAAAMISPSLIDPPGWIHGGHARGGQDQQAVGEGEEGVAGRGPADRPVAGLGHRDLGRYHP